MYRHIEKVKSLCPIPIETVKIDFDYWFGYHIKTKGKRKGQAGYGWPDFRNRWCTALKKEASSFVLYGKPYNPRKRGIAVDEYHGIAVDELERCKKNKQDGRIIHYPLVEWNMTEAECLSYCYSLGFDWEGLYEEGRSRVSCFCCPLQRIGELRLTYQNHQELWKKMLDMDKHSFRAFRSDYTLEQLTEKMG